MCAIPVIEKLFFISKSSFDLSPSNKEIARLAFRCEMFEDFILFLRLSLAFFAHFMILFPLL